MPPLARSLGLAVAADGRTSVGSLRERSTPFEFPPDVGWSAGSVPGETGR